MSNSCWSPSTWPSTPASSPTPTNRKVTHLSSLYILSTWLSKLASSPNSQTERLHYRHLSFLYTINLAQYASKFPYIYEQRKKKTSERKKVLCSVNFRDFWPEKPSDNENKYKMYGIFAKFSNTIYTHLETFFIKDY